MKAYDEAGCDKQRQGRDSGRFGGSRAADGSARSVELSAIRGLGCLLRKRKAANSLGNVSFSDSKEFRGYRKGTSRRWESRRHMSTARAARTPQPEERRALLATAAVGGGTRAGQALPAHV